MLSISGIKNAAYYENLATEDYYENGGEPAGRWQGTGADNLGLKSELQNGQLKQMLEGYHPKSGEALASNAGEDHRRGHDLCFSAPKSVSTVWASADEGLREQIQQAQAKAVGKAVEYIEDNVANIRRGKGGVEHEQAHIIAASYEHSTSRAQDPQLHTHMLVASHGIGQETGDVRSLDSRSFFQHQKAVGAVYRAELASEMQKLGFAVERDGQSFRIAGSNEELEQAWSKRRQEVEQQLEVKGTGGAKAAEAAALSSRETKQTVNRQQLFEKWNSEAQAHGFSAENIQHNSDLEYERPEFKTDNILSAATEQQAVFSKAQLHSLVAQELQGVGGADELKDRLQQLEQSGELINLGKRDNQQQYTTREMLRIEQNIVNFARDGQEKESWKVSEKHIQQAINNKTGISTEQQNALRHITGNGQVSCVTGAAGTGKSYMLSAAKEAFEAQGYKVTGCSLSGKAAAELQGGSGIQSQTIHSLLNELDNGRRTLDSKDVIVMDEAGMTDTRLMSRVVDAVKSADAKLILVGDTAQLQAVNAGGSFGKVSAEIGSAEILEVRRQKIEWQKQAANDFRSGKAAAALAAYKANDALHINKTTKSTHEKMVERWQQSDAKLSEKMMIAGRRKDVSALNKIARSELKKSGQLGAEVTAIATDKDSNESRIKIAEGERLRFTKNDKSLGLMNGDLGTVKNIDIDRGGNTILDVQLDRDASKTVRINMSEYSQMQHGYCITAHASQGATVDNAFFYASSFNSKELSYVAASRQRHGCEIFASEEEVGSEAEKELERLMSKSDEKITALEQLEAQVEKDIQHIEHEAKQAEQEAEHKTHEAEREARRAEVEARQDAPEPEQEPEEKEQEKQEQEPQQQGSGDGGAARGKAEAAKTISLNEQQIARTKKANAETEAAFNKAHSQAKSQDERAQAKQERKQQMQQQLTM
ncbi:MobF family relaxase [Mariprofundus ferrooxydans]|uniref:MobF family relaxase n=1 Tax=Mariprofundus ferrooxydans TaxID=314344 RepID=UPI00035FB91A|nr:MobF family relaxase [Mariprofundus ferrooxydans]